MSGGGTWPDLAATVLGLWGGTARHLVECTLVFAGILLLAALLRRVPAWVRHGLWMIVGLKILLPTALVARYLPPPSLPARPAAAPPGLQLGDSTPTVPQLAFGLARSAGAAVAGLTPQPAAAKPALLLMFAGVWGLGTIGIAARRLRGSSRVARLVHEARVVRHGSRLRTMRDVARSVGLRSEPALALSEEATEPGVWGVIRPVVVLPDALATALSDAELAAVLRHELTHVRRRDNLIAILQGLVSCLYWYFPVAWIVERRMLAERERACDESVWSVSELRAPYLAGLSKACRVHWAGAAVGMALAGGSAFTRRIEAMRNGNAEAAKRWWHGWCVGSIAILVAVAAIAVSAQTEPAATIGSAASKPAVRASREEAPAGTVTGLFMAPSVPARFAKDDGTFAEPLPHGGKVRPPVAIERVKPTYPPAALRARVEGIVNLRVVIDRAGRITEVEAIKSHPLLAEAAAAAARQCRFRPATLNGRPVSVWTTLSAHFVLK